MFLIKFGKFSAISFSNIFCSFLFLVFWFSRYAYVGKLMMSHIFGLAVSNVGPRTLDKVAQGQSGPPCSECSAPDTETLQYEWGCAAMSLWPGHTHQEFSLCNCSYSEENCWWCFPYKEETMNFDWEYGVNPVFSVHLPRFCVMLSYEEEGDSGSCFKRHRFSLFLSSFRRFYWINPSSFSVCL